MKRYWLLCALLVCALLAGTAPAAAHDWYPLECCHALDCAPVEKVDFAPTTVANDPATALPVEGTGPLNASGADAAPGIPAPGIALGEAALLPGAMLVTTQHGSVIVPANFPRRESKDHRMHACMRPGADGTMRLICIFLPPSM
jgi:hypothetical protein